MINFLCLFLLLAVLFSSTVKRFVLVSFSMGCVHGKCFGHINKCCCCRCNLNVSCCSRCAHCEASSKAATAGARHDDSSKDRGGRLSPVLSGASLGSADVPSAGLRLVHSSLTQRGYYPGLPDRPNQDSFFVKVQFQGNPELHLFGVFDGHGQYGAECAEFARDKLADILSGDPRLMENPVETFDSAFAATNSALHDSEIDDRMSGTTAIVVLVRGDTLFVANVGDSRAVAGVCDGHRAVAEDLSRDQTPFRRDEYERAKLCGAMVLSFGQLEGHKDPNIQTWGDEDSDEDDDPPRLWFPNAMHPGTAFTRSVGDSDAGSIGVIAVPEVKVMKITENHQFLVIASDGVFQFLSSQAVVDMVSSVADPRDACSTIVAESYKLWLDRDYRTDDITVIIVQIKHLFKVGSISSSWISFTQQKGQMLEQLNNAQNNTQAFVSDKSTYILYHQIQLQLHSPFLIERTHAFVFFIHFRWLFTCFGYANPNAFTCQSIFFPLRS
ncbi:hypothetical protein Cni_G11920 [Canna indica]|uniref:protein-serine/threonine phosphatase n=1 Tax=Canna indica TaxID=4628 RepID=A0AAQ3K8U4_9LILI|nr:hypothetical protein Cni_G11920 [Canna indica]